MPTMRGSLEILTGVEPDVQSTGLEVEAITPEFVPALVAALYGYTDIEVTEPQEHAYAAWAALDTQLNPVTITLWPESEFTSPGEPDGG